ncbi:MAG TPA: TylF/MycF/NovP-related O-methyltransferase [Polyangiaceae bacterium]|jgi:O-methyltransferase|nr:TylF/MycF/NovP-related O-methyltransferase [Polyangiaceae bacterium]
MRAFAEAWKPWLRSVVPVTLYDRMSQTKQRLVDALDTTPAYAHDGMRLYGKSLDFLSDPAFVRAYQAGMNTGHHICRAKGSVDDIHNEYRVYICCWAARSGLKLQGDFVECGVNTGITSVAICSWLDFGTSAKQFYLFDTYRGIPIEQATAGELRMKIHENNEFYEECFTLAKENFAPWPNCVLVRGRVPDTLGRCLIQSVAYLHIDMNVAAPEIAAIEHFWPRLVTGGLVVLDDYGFVGYRPQKDAMDAWAARTGAVIATLPTGQGLIVKT